MLACYPIKYKLYAKCANRLKTRILNCVVSSKNEQCVLPSLFFTPLPYQDHVLQRLQLKAQISVGAGVVRFS